MPTRCLSSGNGLGLCIKPKGLRTNHERPPFAFQKAINCTLKGRLSQCERRPFRTALIINGLQRCACRDDKTFLNTLKQIKLLFQKRAGVGVRPCSIGCQVLLRASIKAAGQLPPASSRPSLFSADGRSGRGAHTASRPRQAWHRVCLSGTRPHPCTC